MTSKGRSSLARASALRRTGDALATSVSGRPTDHNYLGNTNTKEVHDLRKETTQCQIGEIISHGHAVVFTPDELETAHSEGYDNGHYCIGGSKR